MVSTTRPVALILGAGSNIGAALAKKFSALGYSVAVVSRTGTDASTPEGYLSLKLSSPSQFKTAPSVVFYNAAARSSPPVPDDMFSFKVPNLTETLNINTLSPFITAQQAVEAWKDLTSETKKTFIYTGNALNVKVIPMPGMVILEIGKAASAAWIGIADGLYSEKEMRFVYADERYDDGAVKGGAIDGEAHAEFYSQLAAHEGSVPWHATFVKDKGYVKFEQRPKDAKLSA